MSSASPVHIPLGERKSTILQQLKNVQDDLGDRLQECLRAANALAKMAKIPAYRKYTKNSLDENRKELEEFFEFERHTKSHAHGDDEGFSEFTAALACQTQLHIWKVIKAQDEKEDKEAMAEELREREIELLEGLAWIREQESKRG